MEEQLSLFDLGVDMRELRGQREQLAEAAECAPSTRRAYASDWRRFSEWCDRAGRVALPASPDTVALYVTSVVSSRRPVSSAARYVAAIVHQHRAAGLASPVDAKVGEVLAGAKRKYGTAAAAKAALEPGQLRAICGKLLELGTPIAVRDQALLVLGFASGLRRSELSALDLADVFFLPRRRLVLRLRRAKNDQKGRGRQVGIFPGRHAATCPVRTLREWIRVRGSGSGPLFTQFRGDGVVTLRRLSGETIAERVRAGVELIGLDPAEYGGHSLRAGCVTAAQIAGAADSAIMQRSGHRSHATMRKYQRSADLFAVNPLAKVL